MIHLPSLGQPAVAASATGRAIPTPTGPPLLTPASQDNYSSVEVSPACTVHANTARYFVGVTLGAAASGLPRLPLRRSPAGRGAGRSRAPAAAGSTAGSALGTCARPVAGELVTVGPAGVAEGLPIISDVSPGLAAAAAALPELEVLRIISSSNQRCSAAVSGREAPRSNATPVELRCGGRSRPGVGFLTLDLRRRSTPSGEHE